LDEKTPQRERAQRVERVERGNEEWMREIIVEADM
jgi:hypothetical protein